MTDVYDVSRTSPWTAYVTDIWLDRPEDPDGVLTRRILRAELVDNASNPDAAVRACILHQRRSSKKQPWKDSSHFNLATLKGDEEVRIQLDAAATYHLHRELARLHALATTGIPSKDERFVVAREDEALVVTGRGKAIVKQLLEAGDEETWNALAELQPDLFKAILVTKLHELRESAVRTFEEELDRNVWSEGQWQQFFESNTWIFGYGLSYRFLSSVQSQPYFGGTDLSGKGAQRGDVLTLTEAERKFTVLVEIKKPSAPLVSEKPYRNQAHLIGGHVAGGVAQLQGNCRTWELAGSRDEHNAERLEQLKGHTVQPKGILVIGNLQQLDTFAKRTSFELFRRNLHNPEVVTYDELLERSRHLLLNEEHRLADSTSANVDEDVPF